MTEQWHTPPPYMSVPQKKRGGFWKATTLVVFVAALGLIGWTWVSGGFKSEDQTAPTASALTAGTDAQSDQAALPEDPQSDADNDGLSLFDEERYGTNPGDADTDRDGYSDGQEVLNGYNPNGAGRLSIDVKPSGAAEVDPNRTTLSPAPEISGVPLSQVYSGSGAYVCRVEGGQQEKNIVTVKVRGTSVRQETPVNGSTMVFIVNDQKTLYLSSFEGSKILELNFDPATATASGNGATIRGGIFANENLVLAANPTSIACEEATLSEKEFSVEPDQILKFD